MSVESYDFLRGLYRNIDPAQSVFMTLTAIHPDGSHPAPSRHIPLSNEHAVREALTCLHEANNKGWGAYFAVAPRSKPLGRWQRGGKKDVLAVPALFIDVDNNRDKTLKLLETFYPLPSAIVSSGGGVHAYWFLQTPTYAISNVDQILRGLAQWCGGDILTAAQSMRLPGTVNTKLKRDGAMCECIDWHPDRRWQLRDFAPYTPVNLLPVPKVQWGERLSPNRVSEWLIRNFKGYVKSNGWIAALCPLGHDHDSPGKHFNWHPELNVGKCFGRHGCLTAIDLADLMGNVSR